MLWMLRLKSYLIFKDFYFYISGQKILFIYASKKFF